MLPLHLLNYGTVKINISKTSGERKLYLSELFKKKLLKLFNFKNESSNNKIITKGSYKNKKTGINNILFIQQVNSVIGSILGKGYTSHSFRQGLVTEMGSKSVNIKIISQFVRHRNVNITLSYIKPRDNQITQSLVR